MGIVPVVTFVAAALGGLLLAGFITEKQMIGMLFLSGFAFGVSLTVMAIGAAWLSNRNIELTELRDAAARQRR